MTLETFHASRGWLKACAYRKVLSKVVTLAVFQPLISLLKLRQAGLQPRLVEYGLESVQKTYDKSVTCEISHKFIGPYVAFAAVGLAHHARTAVCRAALLVKTPGGGGSGGGGGGGSSGGQIPFSQLNKFPVHQTSLLLSSSLGNSI